MEPCHRGNALRLAYRDRDRWSAIVRRLSLRKIEYEGNFLSRFSSYSSRKKGKGKKKKGTGQLVWNSIFRNLDLKCLAKFFRNDADRLAEKRRIERKKESGLVSSV